MSNAFKSTRKIDVFNSEQIPYSLTVQLYYVTPGVVSGANILKRGVFSAMKYFSKYIHCSMWSFSSTFIIIELRLVCVVDWVVYGPKLSLYTIKPRTDAESS